jgi:hypothetical protein
MKAISFEGSACASHAQVLEQDAQRERQPPRRQAGLFQSRETMNLVFAAPDLED